MLETISCSWNAKRGSVSNSSNRPVIDRLLDEAAALRRATDIRDYVGAVNAGVRRDAASISFDAIERWSEWALAEADRIDPIKTARFLEGLHVNDDAK